MTVAYDGSVPSFLPSKLLYHIAVTREETDKKLAAALRIYKDHHDRQARTITPFTPSQFVYVDGPSLTKTATNRLATDTYSKLLPHKLVLYRIL